MTGDREQIIGNSRKGNRQQTTAERSDATAKPLTMEDTKGTGEQETAEESKAKTKAAAVEKGIGEEKSSLKGEDE